MKKLLLPLLLVLSSPCFGQALNTTPTAYAAYISPSVGVWNPWTSASAFGALSTTPPAIGLYCQANPPSGPWTPCAPGGSSGGVTSINATTGAFTFTGAGVTCVGTTCTFTGTGSGITQLTGAVLAGPGSGSQATTISGLSTTGLIPTSNGSGALLASGITADTSGNATSAGLASFKLGFAYNPKTLSNPGAGDSQPLYGTDNFAGDLDIILENQSTATNARVLSAWIGGSANEQGLFIGANSSTATGTDFFSAGSAFIFTASGLPNLYIGNEFAGTGPFAHTFLRNGGGGPSGIDVSGQYVFDVAFPFLNGAGGILATLPTTGELALATTAQKTITINSTACVLGGTCTVTTTSPISGATVGQALIAGSATTATSSIAINGAGAGLVTGPSAPTSGDVAFFTGGAGAITDGLIAGANLVTAASALTANQIVLGAGSKTTAVLGSLGTTTTVLHGNAAGAPSFGAVVLTTDVSGLLPIANGGTGSATAAANTVFGNPTGSSAAPSYTSAPSVVTLAASTSITTLLYLSGTPAVTDTGILSQFTGNTNSYVQSIIQNTNGGSTASADWIAYNDLGAPTTHYEDCGINSSTFSGTGSLAIAGAGYCYTATGDMVLATLSANSVHIVANNNATDAITVTSANAVILPQVATSPSTSPICPNGTGGALTTSGCAGSGTLAGDVTGAFGANTVVKVNNGAIPVFTTAMGSPQLSVNTLGQIKALPQFGYMAAYGNSYVASQGTIYFNQSFVSLIHRDVPAPLFPEGVAGVPMSNITVSAMKFFYPNPALPSLSLLNGVENNATSSYDSCGGTVGTACTFNYLDETMALLSWTSVPWQRRFFASTATQAGGTWTVDTTLANIAGSIPVGLSSYIYTTPGTPMKISTSGATLTFSLTGMTTSQTMIGVKYLTSNALTGTFTVTIDGSLVTDNGSGTTTFSNAPYVALPGSGSTTVPAEQWYTVTGATSHTVVITTTSAAQVSFINVDTSPQTADANLGTNMFVGGIGLSAWPYTVAYNTVSNTALTTLRNAGYPNYYVDITGMPSTGTSSTTTTSCEKSYFASHPNACGNVYIAQQIEATAIANGIPFASYAGGSLAVNQSIFDGPLTTNMQSIANGVELHSTYTDNLNPSNITGRYTAWSSQVTPSLQVEFGFGYGQDKSTGLPFSSALVSGPYGAANGWACARLFTGSTTWVETQFTSKWCASYSTGATYQLGSLTAPIIIGNSIAPTFTAGTGAGTTPTITLSRATNMSGVINVTTGTLPTLSATVVTVTFATTTGQVYTAAPKCTITPANVNAQTLVGVAQAFVIDANTTTTAFQVTAGATALPAATALVYSYLCTQ